MTNVMTPVRNRTLQESGFITFKQAATQLNISMSSVYRLVDSGLVSTHRHSLYKNRRFLDQGEISRLAHTGFETAQLPYNPCIEVNQAGVRCTGRALLGEVTCKKHTKTLLAALRDPREIKHIFAAEFAELMEEIIKEESDE